MPSLDPTSALMSHSVCVYRRPDRYLFQAYVPHHTGHGSVPTDSILSAPLAVPCDVLGNTLLTALDSAALLPPPSGPSRQPPLFREAGVRGTRAFFRDTLVCFVDRSDTELVFTATAATNSLGSGLARPAGRLLVPASGEECGRHLLLAFQLCTADPTS